MKPKILVCQNLPAAEQHLPSLCPKINATTTLFKEIAVCDTLRQTDTLTHSDKNKHAFSSEFNFVAKH